MRTVPQITLEQAAAKVRSGDALIVGGFGMTGNPTNIMHALAETEVEGLTYIGNNVGEPGLAGGRRVFRNPVPAGGQQQHAGRHQAQAARAANSRQHAHRYHHNPITTTIRPISAQPARSE